MFDIKENVVFQNEKADLISTYVQTYSCQPELDGRAAYNGECKIRRNRIQGELLKSSRIIQSGSFLR